MSKPLLSFHDRSCRLDRQSVSLGLDWVLRRRSLMRCHTLLLLHLAYLLRFCLPCLKLLQQGVSEREVAALKESLEIDRSGIEEVDEIVVGDCPLDRCLRRFLDADIELDVFNLIEVEFLCVYQSVD